ncbi:MAG TPA: hypothetical protein VFZ59_04515 [Verrucomicrobiae bacterium]|nr:hypothetical protein [Verrucomicrobiae bacterium]
MTTATTLPDRFPATLDDLLRLHVATANLSRSEQLMRVRAYEAERLRAKYPGATDSDIKTVFIQRQRQPFKDEAEWCEYARNYATWWAAHRDRVKRSNSRLLKKPLDQPNGDGG